MLWKRNVERFAGHWKTDDKVKSIIWQSGERLAFSGMSQDLCSINTFDLDAWLSIVLFVLCIFLEYNMLKPIAWLLSSFPRQQVKLSSTPKQEKKNYVERGDWYSGKISTALFLLADLFLNNLSVFVLMLLKLV